LAQHAAQDSDEMALAMLAGAFAQDLGGRVVAASIDLELLLSSVPTLLDLADALAACATRDDSAAQARHGAVRRLALPPTPELKRLLAGARDVLRRAELTTATLRALGGSPGSTVVASLIPALVDVLRPSVAPWADVSVGANGTCVVSASPILVALIVATLLASAADSIRAARRDRGRIEVRVGEREDAVVIEVQDDGLEIPADLRPSLRQTYFGRAPSRLARVRDHAIRSGGDLMIDTDPSGTTVRVLLPITDREVVFDPHEPAVVRAPTKH
jgi:signal transduction histidine kinase